MKTLYFDCSSGISGNMTLGALTEIVGNEKYLLDELKKLNVDGYHIEISKKVKNGITGTYVDVILEHGHRKEHSAGSKVHNKSLEEIHFHEIGAIDSIVDIVGTAILINKINLDKIISSVVNDRYGFIECAHGTISVPVPATSEIFAASNVI